MENVEERFKKIMEILEPQSGVTSDMIKELFNLHNYYYPNNVEHGTNCSGCRARVYGRMLRKYNEENG
jgi:hypothetical protein